MHYCRGSHLASSLSRRFRVILFHIRTCHRSPCSLRIESISRPNALPPYSRQLPPIPQVTYTANFNTPSFSSHIVPNILGLRSLLPFFGRSHSLIISTTTHWTYSLFILLHVDHPTSPGFSAKSPLLTFLLLSRLRWHLYRDPCRLPFGIVAFCHCSAS